MSINRRHLNDSQSTLASAYTAGSGSLTVADGAEFGTPTPTNWINVAVLQGTTVKSLLKCTGRTGNTLTIAGALEGYTDVNLAAGLTVISPVSAGSVDDIATLVNTLETQMATKAAAADLTSHTSNTSNPHSVTAAQVGAYTTTQVDTALVAKADAATLTAHVSSVSNPHGVTAAQVGAYTTTQVDTALAGKSDTTHNHDTRYYTETEVDTLLGAKAAAADLTSHTSNTSNPHSVTAVQVGAYTTTEVDTLLSGKSNVGHNHDTRYYTETEVDTLLGAKADASALTTHTSDTTNPHSVTAAQVGAYTEAEVDTLLAGKSDTGHTHTLDNLSDVTVTSPTNGQVLKFNGTIWVNDTDSTGGGGSGTPPGSDTQVIFNDGGAYGADAGMTYNKTTDSLSVLGSIVAQGAYTETTTTPGIYLGRLASTSRMMFANGTASENWQIDADLGRFRWYTPGVEHLKLDPSMGLGVKNTMTVGAVDPDWNYQFRVISGYLGRPVIVSKGAASQSANLYEGRNSSDSVLFSVDPNGAVTTPTVNVSSQVYVNRDSSTTPMLRLKGNQYASADYPLLKCESLFAASLGIYASGGSVKLMADDGAGTTTSMKLDPNQFGVVYNDGITNFLATRVDVGGGGYDMVVQAYNLGSYTHIRGNYQGLKLGVYNDWGRTQIVNTVGTMADFYDGTSTFTPLDAGDKVVVVKGAASQTANLTEWQNSSGTALSAVRADGSIKPAHLADSAAANDSLYYSTDAGKIVYKDSLGVVNALY